MPSLTSSQNLALFVPIGLALRRSWKSLKGVSFQRILQALNEADVILCQLSQDFLASDYCMRTEPRTALRRREAGDVQLLPYVLEPCLATPIFRRR